MKLTEYSQTLLEHANKKLGNVSVEDSDIADLKTALGFVIDALFEMSDENPE